MRCIIIILININQNYSIEKKFFIVFFSALTFSSASTKIVPSCSYLTAIDRSADQTRLDFFPSWVISNLSTTSSDWFNSHLVFRYAVVYAIFRSIMIDLKDFDSYLTEFIIFIISSSARAAVIAFFIF